MSDEKKTEHESFGMIGLSQVSGQAVLVGSAVRHQHFIELSVHESVKYSSEYHERFHATKKICEVWLSHAQLAELLFSVNQGDGIPCTIHWARGDIKPWRESPTFENPFKQSSDDLKSALQKTLKYAHDLAKEAEALVKKKLSTKQEREQLEFLAMKIAQDIESNLTFVSRCMDEKVEKNIAQAKSEIETFVDLKLKLAGMEHMANQFALGEGTPKKLRGGNK